jgi:hypothetical protein
VRWSLDPDQPGASIIRIDCWGTALFGISAVLAALAPDVFTIPAIIVALLLFGVGCVVFLWAFATSVERSRLEEVSVAGVYLLQQSTPRQVQWHLHGALATQIVLAFATAAARPFTSLAFGILVPMFGLGLNGLWAARYGRFAKRAELDHKRPRRRQTPSPSVPTTKPSEGEQVR